MNPARPLVSVITVVLNGAPAIARAVQSVLAQTYAPLEYIVIDGGSTDDTLEIIRPYEHRLARLISEPDRGISDAFNKGLRLASGDLVQLLNADDWLEPGQIERAVGALDRTAADFVFGDLVYHDPTGRPTHRVRGDPGYARRIGSGMPDLNHPTVLARREVYERIGGFDPDLRYAMDYDWLLRAHRAGFMGVYEPGLVGHMGVGGAADRRWQRALLEVMQVSRRHGCPPTRAAPLLLYRLFKGMARRQVERLAPARVHDALRARANQRFTSKA